MQTKRHVVLAPGRARRPGAGGARIEDATQDELDACPFCAGREDRTPPETLRLGKPWVVRVVPNLYPAFERQEVVVHSPRHIRSFAEAADEEVRLVADAWQQRRAAEPGGYLFALINEGRLAGASLAHSHSQLVWMDEAPPAVRNELLDERGHVAFERGPIVVAAPRDGRVPYELRIEPAGPEPHPFTSELLGEALLALRDAVRRVRSLEGPVPWNAWLHTEPHWHFELFPRLTVLAGVELGAGIYVNTLPPEEAAAALQSAASSA